MDKKQSLALVIIALLGAALIWVLFFWNPVGDKAVKHETLELSAKPTGGDFTVEIQNKDLSLKDLRGKVVLLYFGYTQCPDICPTSLSLMTQALNQLSKEELADVRG